MLEGMLALALGGLVISLSSEGLQDYNDGIRVQAAASQLKRLTDAAKRYGDDNYTTLAASASLQLPITVLQPYVGNVALDPFKGTYFLTTRRYPITVPNPAGGTRTIQAVEILVGSRMTANSQLRSEPSLRAKIANTAGNGAGFVSVTGLTCQTPAGAARPAGSLCGAYGSWSHAGNAFPATPSFADVGYISSVIVGDSTVYGDQLYRYDMGDPELNSMSTTLYMKNNDIDNPRNINAVDTINFAGTAREITTTAGSLNLRPADSIVEIEPAAAGGTAQLRSTNGNLQINTAGTLTQFGAQWAPTMGSATRQRGTADIAARDIKARDIEVESVNSTFATAPGRGAFIDPLRLQQAPEGQVIVGNRVRFTPTGAGSAYEVTDGTLRTGVVAAREITCADCGGDLSAILPKWRHMGTYAISANQSGTLVPKPACAPASRRTVTNVATLAGSGEPSFSEGTSRDNRYVPKIIITPKQFATSIPEDLDDPDRAVMSYNFHAVDPGGANWRAYAVVRNGSNAQTGVATGLAMTYCVFTGGTQDPTDTSDPSLTGGGTYTRLE